MWSDIFGYKRPSIRQSVPFSVHWKPPCILRKPKTSTRLLKEDLWATYKIPLYLSSLVTKLFQSHRSIQAVCKKLLFACSKIHTSIYLSRLWSPSSVNPISWRQCKLALSWTPSFWWWPYKVSYGESRNGENGQQRNVWMQCTRPDRQPRQSAVWSTNCKSPFYKVLKRRSLTCNAIWKQVYVHSRSITF